MNEDKVLKSEAEYKAEQEMLAKPWADSSVDEKLEKIRYSLMNQPNHYPAIYALQNELRTFKNHEHNAKGELMIPMQKIENGGSLSPGTNSVLGRRNPLA